MPKLTFWRISHVEMAAEVAIRLTLKRWNLQPSRTVPWL
jgi:hypothetical protein